MKKNSLRNFASVCAVVVTLSACSELNAVHVKSQNDNRTAGAPYALSFTQFEVTVTRRVTQCVNKNGDSEVKVGVSAEISRAEARDPKREYVIDFTTLNSFFKATDLNIEYQDDGTLKSINASAEDHTGEFITDVVTSIGKIVTAVVSRAAGAATPSCSAEVSTALSGLSTAKEKAKYEANKVNDISDDIEVLRNQISALGKTKDPELSKQLSQAIGQLRSEQKTLKAARENLANILDTLSDVQQVKWPKDGETFASQDEEIPDLSTDTLKKWVGDQQGNLLNKTKVYFKIIGDSPAARLQSCENNCPDDSISGIKYRFPASGRFMVCSDPLCSNPDNLIATEAGLFSQLGSVHVIPLKSTIFTTKSISAAFTKSGTLSAIGLKAGAASDKASQLTSSVLDQALAIRGKVIKTKAEKMQDELTDLKLQKDLMDAQNALKPPQNAEDTEATAASSAKAALYQALLAEWNAKQALLAANPSAVP